MVGVNQRNDVGFRLSSQQRHLWRLMGGSCCFHAAGVLSIEGPLRREIIEPVIDAVVSRHSALNTQYYQDESWSLPLQIQMENKPEVLSPDQIRALLERRSPPDLNSTESGANGEGSTIQICLVSRAFDRHEFFWRCPALSADHRSLEILMEEIAQGYEAALTGESPPSLSSDYRHFSEWQNHYLAEDAAEEAAFWVQQSLQCGTRIQLPGYRETDASVWKPQSLERPVREETNRELEALAIAWGTTPPTIVQCAWRILVYRLTDRTESVMSVRFPGRPFEELAQTVGLFEQNLPVALNLNPRIRLAEVVEACDRAMEVVEEHGDAFDWRLLSSNGEEPFLNLSFASENRPSEFRAGGCRFQIVRCEAVVDRYHLRLVWRECEQGPRMAFAFNGLRYSKACINQIASRFATLLDSLMQKPELTLNMHDLLPPAERHVLLHELNQNDPLPKGAHRFEWAIEDQIARNQDAVALALGDTRISFSEMDRHAGALAQALLERGAGPETIVGMVLERRPEAAIGMWGILKTGAAYLPIDPELPRNRISYMLDLAGAKLVVGQRSCRNQLGSKLPLAILLDGLAPAAKPFKPRHIDGQHPAYLIFTSGSSGRPKGVSVSRDALSQYLHGFHARLKAQKSDGYATVSSLAADLGNTAVFSALTRGGALHLLGKQTSLDPVAMAEYMSRNRVDWLKIVPSHLNAWLSHEQHAFCLPNKGLIFGGERLDRKLVEALRKQKPELLIYNHYGPTEATVGAVMCRLKGATPERIPIGRPLRHSRLLVLDPIGQPAPLNIAGQLCIGGPALARGYQSRPDATAAQFSPEPFSGLPGQRLYQTGDLARWNPEGLVEFLGRTDQQLKINGYRVEPGEIEVLLQSHEGVDKAIVTARDFQELPRLTAYIVPASGAAFDERLARDFLASQLPAPMLPRFWVLLDMLPLTPNGKVDRAALPAPKEVREAVYAPPRNQVETALANIWAQILGRERVGIHDNFFELGGDSIMAIQIISRAVTLGHRFEPRDIFQRQTVAGLAALLEGASATPTPEGTTTGDSQGEEEAFGWDSERVASIAATISQALEGE